MLLLTACAGPAALHLEAAEERGYEVLEINADGWPLTVYRPPSGTPEGGRWHIYLTGDGTPWTAGGRIRSRDPTPRGRLTLALMDLDTAPRLLLHRPCYARHPMETACHPLQWTDARYSEQVVETMDAALNRLAEANGMKELVLIGYSGGGTLARLLAGRREDVTALVTIAANLDHDAWTRHHGYLPLTGSLHVTRQPPLDPGVRQWHFAGGRDTVVPPDVVRRGLRQETHARLTVVPGYHHGCCWEEQWPRVLAWLAGDPVPPSTATRHPAGH